MNINPNQKESVSQKQRILDYIKKGHMITQVDAFNKFGCFRLSARIKDLKAEGHNIKTKSISKNGKLFAGYYLGEDSDRTENQSTIFD
jgi:hypothetical protein